MLSATACRTSETFMRQVAAQYLALLMSTASSAMDRSGCRTSLPDSASRLLRQACWAELTTPTAGRKPAQRRSIQQVPPRTLPGPRDRWLNSQRLTRPPTRMRSTPSGLAATISSRSWRERTHRNMRSEERRVGKECRSRGTPYHLKNYPVFLDLKARPVLVVGAANAALRQTNRLLEAFFKQKAAYEMPK